VKKQEVKSPTLKSKLGLDDDKIGEVEVNKRMKGESEVSQEECSSCGSINLEVNEDIVKCLNCGMGKYKAGRHKGVR